MQRALRSVLILVTLFLCLQVQASEYIRLFCATEVKAYCKNKSDAPYLCLKDFQSKLSPTCKSAFAAYTREVNQYFGPCLTEPANNCMNLEPGLGLIDKCLNKIATKVSKACSTHINKSFFEKYDDVGLDAVAICGDTIQKFCPNVQLGHLRINNCLKKNLLRITTNACKIQARNLKY